MPLSFIVWKSAISKCLVMLGYAHIQACWTHWNVLPGMLGETRHIHTAINNALGQEWVLLKVTTLCTIFTQICVGLLSFKLPPKESGGQRDEKIWLWTWCGFCTSDVQHRFVLLFLCVCGLNQCFQITALCFQDVAFAYLPSLTFLGLYVFDATSCH